MSALLEPFLNGRGGERGEGEGQSDDKPDTITHLVCTDTNIPILDTYTLPAKE